jgi:hypothetical protein
MPQIHNAPAGQVGGIDNARSFPVNGAWRSNANACNLAAWGAIDEGLNHFGHASDNMRRSLFGFCGSAKLVLNAHAPFNQCSFNQRTS